MIDKKILIIFGLLVISIYLPTKALVVLLNGTCSAGKTTIARKIIELMKAEFKPIHFISVDAIAQSIAQKNGLGNSGFASSDAENELYQQAIQEAIVQAKNFHDQQKIVLVDVVLLNDSEVMQFKEAIGHLDVKHLLIYSELKTLFLNIAKRNDDVNDSEKRHLLLPFKQFLHFYTCNDNELNEEERARFIQLKLSDVRDVCEKIFTRMLPQSDDNSHSEKVLVDILAGKFCENFKFSLRSLSGENLFRRVRLVANNEDHLNESVVVCSRIAYDKIFENVNADECALQIKKFINQQINFYCFV